MKKLILIILCTLIITKLFGAVSYTDYSEITIAKILGWHTGKPPGAKKCPLCNGYYTQSSFIANTPNPPPLKTTQVTITSQGPVIFRTNGDSILQNNVRITQPGRLIRADKAIIHRDSKTGKITTITLEGHVLAEEYGKLMAGKKAIFNIKKNQLTIYNAIYHLKGEHELLTAKNDFDAWGTAGYISHVSRSILDLTDASYTTCPPLDPSWILSASKIHLDKTTQKGYAKNMVLRFQKIPILWTPYYSFPLSNKRKSGFLSPTLGYEAGQPNSGNHFGTYVAVPYYWDMAPNYDFLFTPEWYSERGTLLHGYFRYLTSDSNGLLYTSFIPDDRGFPQFQTTTINNASGTASQSSLAPYIARLQNASSTRGYIDFENDATFNQSWNGKLYLRYVTDPYFPNDFPSLFLNSNTNQLPSFGQLNYLGEHWNSSLLIESYETLHPISQFLTPAQNQYTRLPEWDIDGSYPQIFSGVNADISAQAVNFDYQSAYYPYTYQRPTGERFHIRPSLSRPIDWASGYFTPQLSIDSTNYVSELAVNSPDIPQQALNINRTLPIFDIDSGLYFDRMMSSGDGKFIQTLEPRIFYLYTPYENQDLYPNFDTQLLPFSFSNLYALNQFTGYDRLQNANQLSLGITSRILNQENGNNLLIAQLGVIDYFAEPEVCLLPGCQNQNEPISPVTGALIYNPNSIWSLTSQIAWDTTLNQMNNAQLGTQFHLDNRHIALVNYTFTQATPDTPFNTLGSTTNSSLLGVGLLWPISRKWDFFGYDYYNFTSNYPETEYGGLSYHTCCFALRFMVENTYNGTTPINGGTTNQNVYNTTYFVQLSLTGLGSAGYQNPDALLTSTLPGFEDTFSSQSHYGYNQNL